MRSPLTRRAFLQAGGVAAGGLLLEARTPAVAQHSRAWTRPGGAVPIGEWWAGGGPRPAPSVIAITGPDEPGEPLLMSGTVYAADGVTPLQGVTVYVYQTDVHGLYNPEGKFGIPHRLRGWVNTDRNGCYEFRTIKPGHYPNRTTPAHIHMTVSRHDMPEWWLPEIRFAGDPLLTQADYAASSNDGRFGDIVTTTRRGGILRCTRDVRL
ncbi:MAG TPA: hypothetical protein VEA16_07755 [Vicinamibacterales bacterium]|nr:hypothetical protein [Vicinamibacterales bacterium]